MPRLPQVGGDNGTWGVILNDFLSVSHSADGSLLANTVGSSQIQDTAITADKLANNSVTQAKLATAGLANGVATLDSGAKLLESQVPERLTDAEIDTKIAAATAAKLDVSSASIFMAGVYYGANLNMARPDVPNTCIWFGEAGTLVNKLDYDLQFVVNTATFSGALDAYILPFRAVSLRRLLASYTGPLIRVRRTSDGVEQDINYDASGNLDVATLLSFAGSASVTVATWYDQSGSARNMTQATAVNQPAIVYSGVLVTVNGKPAIDFDGATSVLTSPVVGLFAAGAATLSAVIKIAASTPNGLIVGETPANGSATPNNYKLIRGSGANWNFQIESTVALTVSGSNLLDDAQHHAFIVDTGLAVSSWKDISTVVHNAVGYTRPAPNPVTFNLGAHGTTTLSGFADGSMQEVIMWTSAYTADRTVISAEQRIYWGTP